MLRISNSMTYWPGCDIGEHFLDSADYQKLPSDRMKSVQEFARIPAFARDVLKARISSIPRWRFIREAQADPGKKS